MEFAITSILFPLLSISLSRHMIIWFWITHSSSYNFQYIKYICHLLSYADGFSLKIMTFVTWIWCIWHVHSIPNSQNTFQLLECVFYVVYYVFHILYLFSIWSFEWNEYQSVKWFLQEWFIVKLSKIVMIFTKISRRI